MRTMQQEQVIAAPSEALADWAARYGVVYCWIAHDVVEGVPRIVARTPFSLRASLQQHMPAGKWHADIRCWSWAPSARTCRRLRMACGPDLQLDPSVVHWYEAEVEREKQAEAERVERLEREARATAERAALEAQRAVYGATDGDPFGAAVSIGPDDEDDEPEKKAARRRERRQELLPEAEAPTRWTLSESSPVARWPWIADAFDADTPRGRMQASGAGWLVANGSGVVGDEVGLGKTLLCLLAVTSYPYTDAGQERSPRGVHLIAAPLKVARATWPQQIRQWVPRARVLDFPLGSAGSSRRVRRLRSLRLAARAAEAGTDRPTFLVVNHEAVRTMEDAFAEVRWASVVIDEAHTVLSVGHRGGKGDTKQAKALMRLATDPNGGMRIACTGTPFAGRLANLWGLIDWCHPGAAGADKGFFRRQFTQPAGDDNGMGRGVSLDRVRAGRERQWGELMSDWVLRRHRLDLFPEQAGMIIKHEPIIVQPTPAQAALDAAWRQRELWTGPKPRPGDDDYERVGKVVRRKDDGVILPDVILAVTRRLQLAVGEMRGLDNQSLVDGADASYVLGDGHSPKVDKVMELLEEWGLLQEAWWHDAGEHGKVIIASPWTASLDLVDEAIRNTRPELYGPGRDEPVVRIDGKSSPAAVDRAVESFTSDRGSQILLLSSTAGGAGLTLDQHCTRLILLGEHWTADVQDQVIGRFSNRTWVTTREVYRIRTAGSIDQYLDSRTLHQSETAASMLELARAGS